ncbi:MAG TPA: condensation domain-containing protein, partial [Thermoanaerobaculia bacterium]
ALGGGLAAALPPLAPLAPVARHRGLRLSFAQERLWFLDQLEPATAAYNLPAALALSGDLDVAALAAGLAAIARRHETLRTTFAGAAGQPRARIAPPGPVPLPLVDLGALPPAARSGAAAARLRGEAARPFDLASGPLLRASLLRLGPDDHVLTLTLHHIVSDGWSFEVMANELAALYDAATESRPPRLPELPVQYVDYAAWQREWLRGEVMERQLAYWRQRLGGADAALALPLDRPRMASASYRGAVVRSAVPPGLLQSVQSLARAEGVTLFMVLAAALATLLARYSGQLDVSLGTPVANRGRREVERLIGLFVNTLVLRLELAADVSFRALLANVREVALGAYAHQDVPFEKLVEDLQPVRDLSRSPLFEVLLALNNQPTARPDLRGLGVSRLPSETGSARFDLALAATEASGGLALGVEFRRELFDAATIGRLLGHCAALLAAAAAGPERRAAALPLLTAPELQQLREWNATGQAPAGADGDLAARLARQAERSPERWAVAGGEVRLTYRELARQARALAARLRALGVGPEVGVAVCC